MRPCIRIKRGNKGHETRIITEFYCKIEPIFLGEDVSILAKDHGSMLVCLSVVDDLN